MGRSRRRRPVAAAARAREGGWLCGVRRARAARARLSFLRPFTAVRFDSSPLRPQTRCAGEGGDAEFLRARGGRRGGGGGAAHSPAERTPELLRMAGNRVPSQFRLDAVEGAFESSAGPQVSDSADALAAGGPPPAPPSPGVGRGDWLGSTPGEQLFRWRKVWNHQLANSDGDIARSPSPELPQTTAAPPRRRETEKRGG